MQLSPVLLFVMRSNSTSGLTESVKPNRLWNATVGVGDVVCVDCSNLELSVSGREGRLHDGGSSFGLRLPVVQRYRRHQVTI